MRFTVPIVGLLLALLIAFGRHLGGIGGSNTIWYALGLALPYFLLSVLLGYRLQVLRRLSRPLQTSGWVSIFASWGFALAFAATVPDVQADSSLAALTAPPGADPVALEMSIALCNPFIILAFVTLGAAIGIAIWSQKDRTAAEDFDGPVEMVQHPLG